MKIASGYEGTTVGLLEQVGQPESAQNAWTDLIARYGSDLRSYTAKQIGDQLRLHLDVNDVINEAWMRVVCRADVFEYRGRRSLFRWVCLMVARVVKDRYRAFARRGGAPMRFGDLPGDEEGGERDVVADDPDPQDAAVHSDELTHAFEALDALPSVYRKPLEQVYRYYRSRSDIAARMGIRRNTLNQRISRGHHLWREELDYRRG
ncbi:MAG: hypothetical protein CMJ83_04045 [Planctomycetes bacterium]|nr:hypothetical protein [Planctomycetota bacterium]